MIDHSLLDWMQFPRFAQALNGSDLTVNRLERQHHAGINRLAVQQDRATTAVTGAATFLGPGQR
jgi:hypothetical protein